MEKKHFFEWNFRDGMFNCVTVSMHVLALTLRPALPGRFANCPAGIETFSCKPGNRLLVHHHSIQNTRCARFIRSKTLALRARVLNLIKRSYSCFKYYLTVLCSNGLRASSWLSWQSRFAGS